MTNLDSFTDPQALPDGGWWTAEYDALDQRNDTAFFLITRGDGREFFVEVDVTGPDEVRSEGFRPWLAQQLAGLAAKGEPNTTHDGSWSLKVRLQGEGRSPASMPRSYSGIFD